MVKKILSKAAKLLCIYWLICLVYATNLTIFLVAYSIVAFILERFSLFNSSGITTVLVTLRLGYWNGRKYVVRNPARLCVFLIKWLISDYFFTEKIRRKFADFKNSANEVFADKAKIDDEEEN